jgi:hypothetical protein
MLLCLLIPFVVICIDILIVPPLLDQSQLHGCIL